MLKYPITYEDLDGNTVTESFYFNFTKTELIEMEVSEREGLQKVLERIVAAEDRKELVAQFKKLILSSYGVKSEDGKRFVKSETLRTEFSQHPAFDALFIKLATDANAGGDFVNGVMPRDLAKLIAEKTETSKATVPAPPLPPTKS